jgi:hypothetical protein
MLGVEDVDDLAVYDDGVGDVDDVREDAGEAEGDGGLAVAGRAVEKDGAAGVQGRPGLLDDAVADREAGHDAADAIAGDEFVGELLLVDLCGELFESDGGGAGVAGLLEGVEGPALAFFGDGVGHLRATVGGAAAEAEEELAIHRQADDLKDDLRGQLDRVGELADGLESAVVDEFHQQGEEVVDVDVRLGQASGRVWHAVQEGVEAGPGDGAHGDEVVAQVLADGARLGDASSAGMSPMVVPLSTTSWPNLPSWTRSIAATP